MGQSCSAESGFVPISNSLAIHFDEPVPIQPRVQKHEEVSCRVEWKLGQWLPVPSTRHIGRENVMAGGH